MKRLKKRMLANRGFSYVITSVLMICVLLIGVAVFEVIRLYIQAGAVRDKFEDSIISMCVENYSEMYQPIRESHAASYRYNGFRWVNSSKANERYIRTYLSRAMNAGEIMQCEIVSVSFNVEPAALAPSDTDSAQKYAVSGTLVIRIPYRFAWQELPPIEMSLDVRSQWQAKFCNSGTLRRISLVVQAKREPPLFQAERGRIRRANKGGSENSAGIRERKRPRK